MLLLLPLSWAICDCVCWICACKAAVLEAKLESVKEVGADVVIGDALVVADLAKDAMKSPISMLAFAPPLDDDDDDAEGNPIDGGS